MRYNVGEKLPVVSCVVNGDNRLGLTIPLLHDSKQPDSIFMKMLTVTEHHRVANYWETDPENKTCDGYILTDEQGVRWLNQYPRASYGQLSDNGDRQFEYDYSGLSKEQISDMIDKEEQYPLFYELLSEHLCRIHRGLDKLPEGHAKIDELKTLLTATVAKAEETFPGFKYEYVPIVFKKTDGTTESYPHIKEVIITFDGK